MLTDVLIVGGGPAGLATALALRQRGASVTVGDAMGPSIDKVCGEGLMPDCLCELALLGVDVSATDGAVFHGIQFVGETQSSDDMSQHLVTAPFPSGTGLGLRRTVLHKRMVERALEAGVTLRWRSHVQMQPDGTAQVAGETVRYKWLVGADGQSSQVRRNAGLEANKLMIRRFGFRQHFAVPPWSPYVEVHWGRTCQAYVAPVTSDAVCVVTMSRSPHIRLANMLEDLPSLAARLRGTKSEMLALDTERGSVMTTRRLRHVSRGRIALVGDASGSVDAITGEGIAMGIRQALLLADCLGTGDSKLGMARYDRLHPQILRVPQTMARAMLLMDRYPIVRQRAMRMLTGEPAIFARMLGVHVGAEPLWRFVASKGPEVAWRLAIPPQTATALG